MTFTHSLLSPVNPPGFCTRTAILVFLAAFVGCGGGDGGGEPGPAPPGTELLANGNFEQGLAHWDTYLEDAGNATYAVQAGEATIDVHLVESDQGGIQLKYVSGLDLQQGTTYRLSFRARATPSRAMPTSIWENGHDLDGDGSAWSTHEWDVHLLTSTMTSFSVEWVMPVANTDSGLCFFMGDPESDVAIEDGEVVIDDVSLVVSLVATD